jgi:hypothetical protein
MKMSNRLIGALVFASVLALVLGACTLPVSTRSPGFYIDVTDPLNGAVIQVGTTLVVGASAYSNSTPITQLDYYASGELFGSSSGADLRSDEYGVQGDAGWTPSEVGEFRMQASARRRGGFLISPAVRVCVVDFSVYPGNTFQTAYGYEGTCPIPPRDSEAKPGPVTMAVAANPSSFVYISRVADGSIPSELPGCSPSRTIHFRATVVDPPQDVAFVTILLSLPPGPGASAAWAGRGAVTTTFILSQTGGFPESTRIFEGTTALRPTLGFIFGDVGGIITWTAEAIGRDGAILVTYGPHEIQASPCAPPVPLSAPSTLTPTGAPTPTVASVGRCDLFSQMSMKLVTLDWQPSTPVTFYLTMPGGVPGLEKPVAGDSEPWQYSAQWGASNTSECKFIQGYSERLYCTISLPTTASESVQELQLRLNGCALPIHTDPRAEVPAYLAEPTPAPVVCPQYANESDCKAAGCTWSPNLVCY